MRINEIKPHLNKIATLYLKNNKRKVGWIFIEPPPQARPPAEDAGEIYFISVQKGKKFVNAVETLDHQKLAPHFEKIMIELIERIRSSK